MMSPDDFSKSFLLHVTLWQCFHYDKEELAAFSCLLMHASLCTLTTLPMLFNLHQNMIFPLWSIIPHKEQREFQFTSTTEAFTSLYPLPRYAALSYNPSFLLPSQAYPFLSRVAVPYAQTAPAFPLVSSDLPTLLISYNVSINRAPALLPKPSSCL